MKNTERAATMMPFNRILSKITLHSSSWEANSIVSSGQTRVFLAHIYIYMGTGLSGMEGGQSQFQLWTGGSLISFTVSLIIFVDHGHTDALSTNQ